MRETPVEPEILVMPNVGILALPAAAVAGMVALTSAAANHPASPGERDRVELEVAGTLPAPGGSSSILVLREKGATTLLPLMVPGGEASDGCGGGASGGSLLGDAIEALGARVTGVEIDGAQETPVGSRVRLLQGHRRLELRARPSQSVALAVAAGVPIVTTRRLLDDAGITLEDLARIHERARRDASRM